MTLHIVTWVWGEKYGQHYVDRLRSGIERNLSEAFRFLIARPQFEDEYLTKIPGCLARLRMFDPEWQALNQIEENERIVCIDLDVVVTGALDPLFCRPEPFLILTGANAVNPNPYNGSVFLLRAGYRPDVWSEFSIDAASKVPWFAFADDQAWLNHKIPGVVGWKVGPQSGIFAFQKPAWPKGSDDLPQGARLVVFPGWRDPSKFTHLDWVKQHWRT